MVQGTLSLPSYLSWCCVTQYHNRRTYESLHLQRHALLNNGPTVSHLYFDDDEIFLREWSIQNAKNLLKVLCSYEVVSTLKVNITKSKLFGLGINNLQNDQLYACGYYNLKNIQGKFSKWKASTLSFGVRLTLCKSVQDSLGIFLFYYIRHQLKVARQRKKKLAWIGWEKILSKQENGGLSISSLKAQNIALLVKWWWHFKEHKHELWKRVIIAIYGQDGGFIVPSRDWNYLVPKKVNILAWRMDHDRILTWPQNLVVLTPKLHHIRERPDVLEKWALNITVQLEYIAHIEL
uniref:Reverse transcriptase domain-containing protein n=1 Tax=Lactuca sativa TaxID=4236 RepID=A0A9R1X6Q7_LACSA|nr:hypothetical protein LSAT_V11C700367430 [Lactuca sativa]